tara:strand:+ start:203 stop:565 length:363 start_codon:yes stop_codon:yes gene_type:complete
MSNNPKDMLIASIKEWIDVNNELNNLLKTVKQKRQQKQQLTNALVNIMKNNEIDCFDIKDGKLLCKTNKVKSSVNKQILLTSLQDYFNNNPDINCQDVSNFILEKRPVKEVNNLIIKFNK